MNSRARLVPGRLTLLSSLMLFGALSLIPVSCGGDGASASSGTGSNGASSASGAAGEWAGVWVDDENVYLLFDEDGRYAKFLLGQAMQDLRFAEPGENKYGEPTLTILNRAAGWEVEGDKLVSYKRPLDPERSDERIAGHTFRRLTHEEEMAYWEASSWRLIRTGDLAEIRRAEANGFTFSRLSDSSITIAVEGQNPYVDVVTRAVKTRQPEVARHFLDQGFEVYSPEAPELAAELEDTELLGAMLDNGLPKRETLRAGIAKDASPAFFEVLFEKGASPEEGDIAFIDRMMIENKDAVRAMFEAR